MVEVSGRNLRKTITKEAPSSRHPRDGSHVTARLAVRGLPAATAGRSEPAEAEAEAVCCETANWSIGDGSMPDPVDEVSCSMPTVLIVACPFPADGGVPMGPHRMRRVRGHGFSETGGLCR